MDIISSPEVLALVPLTIGVVEAIKAVGLDSRFAPFVSVVIGAALASLVLPFGAPVILGGIAIGLMASGLYSGTRAIVRN